MYIYIYILFYCYPLSAETLEPLACFVRNLPKNSNFADGGFPGLTHQEFIVSHQWHIVFSLGTLTSWFFAFSIERRLIQKMSNSTFLTFCVSGWRRHYIYISIIILYLYINSFILYIYFICYVHISKIYTPTPNPQPAGCEDSRCPLLDHGSWFGTFTQLAGWS